MNQTISLNEKSILGTLEWSEDELIGFIHEAHIHTYAAKKNVSQTYRVKNFLSDHIDFEYKKGNWSYRDSYTGFYWPPGKEVIFYKGKPCWCMSYQGMLVGQYTKDRALKIYQFLKNCLKHTPKHHPFRGPDNYFEDDFTYRFSKDGDAFYFTGREEIYQGNELVFFQDIMATAIFDD